MKLLRAVRDSIRAEAGETELEEAEEEEIDAEARTLAEARSGRLGRSCWLLQVGIAFNYATGFDLENPTDAMARLRGAFTSLPRVSLYIGPPIETGPLSWYFGPLVGLAQLRGLRYSDSAGGSLELSGSTLEVGATVGAFVQTVGLRFELSCAHRRFASVEPGDVEPGTSLPADVPRSLNLSACFFRGGFELGTGLLE